MFARILGLGMVGLGLGLTASVVQADSTTRATYRGDAYRQFDSGDARRLNDVTVRTTTSGAGVTEVRVIQAQPLRPEPATVAVHKPNPEPVNPRAAAVRPAARTYQVAPVDPDKPISSLTVAQPVAQTTSVAMSSPVQVAPTSSLLGNAPVGRATGMATSAVADDVEAQPAAPTAANRNNVAYATPRTSYIDSNGIEWVQERPVYINGNVYNNCGPTWPTRYTETIEVGRGDVYYRSTTVGYGYRDYGPRWHREPVFCRPVVYRSCPPVVCVPRPVVVCPPLRHQSGITIRVNF